MALIKRLLLTAFLLWPSLACAEVPTQRTWTPDFWGGASRFQNVLWDKDHAGTVYATADVSGAFISTDSAATWKHLPRSMACAQTGAIVQSDSNPDVFYMTCENFYSANYMGIWKSTDHAVTWTAVQSTWQWLKGTSLDPLAIDHSDPNIIYAGMPHQATNSGTHYYGKIYKSTDGGANWTEIFAPWSDTSVRSLHLTADNKYLFATSAGSTVDNNVAVFDVDAGIYSTFAIAGTYATNNYQVQGYTTTDGIEHVCVTAGQKLSCTTSAGGWGSSWSDTAAAVTGTNILTRFDVAVDGAAARIFATGNAYGNSYSTLYRTSLNAGTSWTTPAMTWTADLTADPSLFGNRFTDTKNYIAINPNDHNQVLMTGLWGIAGTADFGANFTNKDKGASNQVNTDIGLAPNGDMVACGMDYGLVVKRAGTTTWVSVVGSTSEYYTGYEGHHFQCKPVGSAAAWAAGTGVIVNAFEQWTTNLSYIVRSANNGTDWATITAPFPATSLDGWYGDSTSGGNGKIMAVCPSNTDVLAYAIQGVHGAEIGGIWISEDAGASWTKTAYDNNPAGDWSYGGFRKALAFDPTDATCQKMAFATSTGSPHSITTNDRFATQTVANHGRVESLAYRPGTSDIYETVEGTAGAALLKKNGVTIATFPGSDNQLSWLGAIYFDPRDSKRVFVAARAPNKDGAVYVSDDIDQDASATWTDITGDLPIRTPVDAMVINYSEGEKGTLYIAGTGGVFKLDLGAEYKTQLSGATISGFSQ